MQVIEHDDEETHASFSPLSAGASLRSLQGIPLAAAGEEPFCTGGQDTPWAKQQGRQAPVALSCNLRTIIENPSMLQTSASGLWKQEQCIMVAIMAINCKECTRLADFMHAQSRLCPGFAAALQWRK